MKAPPVVRKTTAVFHQSGALPVGRGKITGIIALTLGGLAVLAVLAFHFPEYLTTPDLRKKYDVGLLRQVLLVGMVIAGGMAIANLV
ncbi:MAG: sterol desaturase family protein, partial [Reyranella sp.]